MIKSVIGFIGFGGILIIYGFISKPWVNFTLETVEYNTDSYSHVVLQNSSRNLNVHSNVKVVFSKESESSIYLDVLNSGTYTNDPKGVTVSLGKGDRFGFTCKNCNVKDSSFENLGASNFSLRSCTNRGGMCMYNDKRIYSIEISAIIFLVGWLLFMFRMIVEGIQKGIIFKEEKAE